MMTPSRLITLAALSFLAAAASAQSWADREGGLDGVFAGAVAGARAAAASSRAAETARPIDLGDEFADPAARNQRTIGSCHIFSSIGTLEAAYFRSYGRRVQLSEEDLFLRKQVLSGDIYADFCANGKCALTEGGHPAQDIQFALDNGVLTGGSYEKFVDRYVKYRAAEVRTMEGLQKMRDEQGWLEGLFYDPRAHWRELQTQPSAARMISDYLTGRDPSAAAERARVKYDLVGFHVELKSYDAGGNDVLDKSAAQCRAASGAQRGMILSELHRNRPVAVSMNLIGLSAWGQTKNSRDAFHAFMIVGVKHVGGKRIFASRNSWGGDNPDVSEDDLCRVYGITTVLIPGEKTLF